MKKLSIIILILIISVFQSSVFQSSGIFANDQEIVLGIVDSSTSPSLFKEGINLAISSLNHVGGTLGRKWRTIVFDDENSPKKGQSIAEKLASNPDVVAVICHRHADVALAASIIYKKEKKLFISPGNDINLYGGNCIFRYGLDDKTKAEKIADYAFDNHFRKIVIFNYYDSYEKAFADLFAKQVNDKQMVIVNRKSFSSWDQNFTPMISDAVNHGDFDAIFISGQLPLAGYVIQQIREMGIMVPILGTDNLDSSSLSIIAGKSAEDTIVPTIFDPTNPVKKIEIFVNDFQSKTGMIPDTWAAMGYDTVKLIAEIIEKSQSFDPVVIDNNLRFIKQWEGVVGSYTLLKDGIIIPPSYFFKRFHNGGFEFSKRVIKEKSKFELIREITLCLPIQAEIKTLDPSFTEYSSVQQLLNLIFTGLTGFDKNNKLTPLLASSWEHSDNHKVYTFKLRKDAFWSDQKPVTAHDVVASLQRNIQTRFSCPGTKFLYTLKNAKAIHEAIIKDVSKLGVKAIDDTSVEFNLEHPLAYFPELLTLPVFWPLPSSIIRDINSFKGLKNIITNGPYKLVFYEPDYLLIFRKNETFFNKKSIQIPEIRFYVIPDGILGVDHFVNKSLDALPSSFLEIPKDVLPYIRSHPYLRQQYYKFVGSTVYSLCFNSNIPPVDDIYIRKAIMASIDTYRLTSIITACGEYPTNSLVPSVKDAKVNFTFNPEEAQNRLIEAGFPDGKGFPRLFISYEDENDKKVAKGIADIISHHLHIDIVLAENKPAHLTLVNRKARYYPGEYLDNLFVLNPSHETLSESFKKVKLLSEQLRLEKNSQNIKNLITTVENIIIQKEAIVMPLFVSCHHSLLAPRVNDWKNRFQGQHRLWQWSLRKVVNIK